MTMKQFGSSLITASLLMGSIFAEVSVAGNFQRSVFRTHHHSHSCKSHANRRNYSVTIANRKSDQQIYWIDGKQYQLRPGHQHTFTKLIGKTHQCRRGSLALPLVEFDRYDNDRHFSSRKVRLSERSRSYYFDRGLNIVTLKKR